MAAAVSLLPRQDARPPFKQGAAVVLINAHGGCWPLIADVGLPDGNGFDVADHARHLMPRVPILIFTGQVDSDLSDRATRISALFVAKGTDGLRMGPLREFIHGSVCLRR